VPRVEWDITTRRAVILLVAVVAIAYGDILFLGRGLFLTDITSYHYPMKHVVRDVVFSGEIPFWNRFFSGGQPLAANPAYELWYPPQWLIFLPSFHYGMQLHIVMHFVLAAIGMLLLLRSLGAGVWASLFGAISFAFGGPYLSLSMKLPLLFSLSWMPLALFFARRCILERRSRDFAGAAISLGMQFLLGEPTIAMQTWALIVAYLVWRRDRRDLVAVASIALAALLIAAIQLVPAVDHARDSVRSQPFTFQVASNWSMPPQRVVEWLMPSVFRHVAPDISTMYPFRTEPFLGEIYVGLLAAILALAGIFAGVRGWGAVTALVALSTIVAAGEHTPVFRLLYDVHLFRAVRYPEKFIVAAAFVLIVWASIVLDRMLAGDRKVIRTAVALAILWAFVAGLLALVASDRAYFGTGALRAFAAAALISMARRKSIAPILVAAVAVDLWWATHTLVPRMPRAFFAAPQLTRELGAPSHAGRVYHQANWDWWDGDANANGWVTNRTTEQFWWLFRNGLLPNLPARWGHELALEEDIDLTALRNTTELRDALVEARRMRPGADEVYAKMSNVRWKLRFRPAISEIDANTQPIEIVETDYPRYYFADAMERAETAMDVRARIDRNRAAQNVAFVDLEPFAPAPGTVTKVEEWNNGARLTTRTFGRALLVMSVTGHKYWSATIDGRPAALLPADIAYQAIVVPAGEHVIEMRYRNPLILVGAIVSLLALTALWAIRRQPRLFDITVDQGYRRPIRSTSSTTMGGRGG